MLKNDQAFKYETSYTGPYTTVQAYINMTVTFRMG